MPVEDAQNAALSLLRFVSRALVQEPQMWRFILERAAEQAAKLGTSIAGDAVRALREAFLAGAPTSREQLRLVAEGFLAEEPARASTRTSSKVLAGQTLLLALRESSVRSVAQ
jgi:hypothetical protein